jgi:hypothetical protein
MERFTISISDTIAAATLVANAIIPAMCVVGTLAATIIQCCNAWARDPTEQAIPTIDVPFARLTITIRTDVSVNVLSTFIGMMTEVTLINVVPQCAHLGACRGCGKRSLPGIGLVIGSLAAFVGLAAIAAKIWNATFIANLTTTSNNTGNGRNTLGRRIASSASSESCAQITNKPGIALFRCRTSLTLTTVNITNQSWIRAIKIALALATDFFLVETNILRSVHIETRVFCLAFHVSFAMAACPNASRQKSARTR